MTEVFQKKQLRIPPQIVAGYGVRFIGSHKPEKFVKSDCSFAAECWRGKFGNIGIRELD